MDKHKYKAVFFDLDGTLIDSMPDIAFAANRVLADHGRASHTQEDYRSRLGWGLRRTMELTMPDLKGDPFDTAVANLIRYYYEEPGVRTVIYPGVPEMLETLKAAGISLFVYTNKDQTIAAKVVRQLFPEGLFKAVFGARDGIGLKPEAEAAVYVVGESGFLSGEILFVGDSEVDMETAAAGRMDALAALWGYRTRDELDGFDKLAYIETPDEIVRWIL